MRIRLIKILLFILITTLLSCEFNIDPVPIPIFEPSNLRGTKTPTDFIKTNTEGIYVSQSKFKPFGDTVIFKWTNDVLSVFTGNNTAYLILQSGYKGEDIYFEGYWRHANSEKTGVVALTIFSNNGGQELITGVIPPEIIIDGLFNGVESRNLKDFTFRRVGDLKPKKKDYWLIAHKGGGRNIDRLPYSENTVELIKYAEYLGANSIEIDIKLTKDKIPILFHDDYVSLRTVNNEYFIGRINEYSYKLLRTSAPLKFGEKIPTLDEALEAVLTETNLKLVWLDIKDPDALSIIEPIQRKYLDEASKIGRNLEIMIGIPDENIYRKVKELNDYQNIPTLCELDESYLIELNALVWAPRWSLGLLPERIKAIHDLGKRAFVWTLDDPELISRYIRDSDFDGIVSNYTPVAAYEYYLGK